MSALSVNRSDFTEADRRYLTQQRGRVCRAVGQAHDRMIDAGHDPSEDMEWLMRWLMHRVRTIEGQAGDFRGHPTQRGSDERAA